MIIKLKENENLFDLPKMTCNVLACSNPTEWLAMFWLPQIQQNDQQFFDLLKVSKQPSKKQSFKKQPSM